MDRYNQNMSNGNHHINNQGYNGHNQNMPNGNHHVNNQGYKSNNQNIGNQNDYINNRDYSNNEQNRNIPIYTEESLKENNLGTKEKNLAIAAGIILVALVLAIIAFVVKDTNNNEGQINENQDMVMATNNEIIPTNNEVLQSIVPSKEVDEEESENENRDDSIATIDPQTLPDPDFSEDDHSRDEDEERRNESSDEDDSNRQEDESQEQDSDRYEGENTDIGTDQSSNRGFQTKKYMLETKPNRYVKIILKGTPRAEIKGKYVYVNKDGELVQKDWDKKLNKDGKATLRYFVPRKVEKIELQILSVEVKNEGDIPECIMEKYRVI